MPLQKISLPGANNFKRIILSLAILSLAFFFYQNICAQTVNSEIAQEAKTLEQGKTVEREIAAGQTHEYQIVLAQNQCLEFIIAERGIELTISINAPDGSLLTEFNAPSADVFAAQSILFVAERSGRYVLFVKSEEPKASAGSYEIGAKDVRDATENDRKLAAAFLSNALGKKLRVDGKYDEAISAEEKSLSILEKMNASADSEIADIVNELGNIYGNKGDYAKAATYYSRALEIYEKTLGKEHFFVASVLNNLGTFYRATGEYEKAEASYQRALSIDEKKFGMENLKVATILGNLAYLYYVKGEYSKAEAPYNRTLAIEAKLLSADSFDAAITFNNVALLYRVEGDYPKAIQLFQRATAIAEKSLGAEHPSVAAMLTNLSAVYSENGDYEKAEELLRRALAIREKTIGADSPDYATTLNTLGTLYSSKKDYEKAEQAFQQALSIREKKFGADNPLIAASLANLADVYRTKGEYEKAEPFLLQALKIVEKKFGKDNASAAPILLNLGSLYFQKGEYEKAESYLKNSLATFEKMNGATHPFTARPLALLASLFAAKGDFAQSMTFQKKYLSVREKNLELNLYTGSERQKLAYMESLSDDLSSTISLHIKLTPQSEESKEMALQLLLSRKGRTLDAIAGSIFTLRRGALLQDKKLLDRLSDIRTRLANLTLKGAGVSKPEEYQGLLKKLEAEKETLEDEMSRRSAEFRTESQPISLDAIRALIPDDAALVEFVKFNPVNLKSSSNEKSSASPQYAVYILRRKGEIQWKDLGDAESIDKTIAAFRQAVRDPKRTDAQTLSRAVDEKIMQPIRALSGDAAHLLISPDGELNLIPFEASVDEKGAYAIEKYSFTYLTSGRDLLKMQTTRESKNKPLIIANPTFGESSAAVVQTTKTLGRGRKRASVTATRNLSDTYFSPLGGTMSEGLAIQTIFPDAAFLSAEQATETALKQVNAPLILHIATHGFFLEDESSENFAVRLNSTNQSSNAPLENENPLLRSGLALAGANRRTDEADDGILTALEASGLNLWGTKLVVLSACDTGVGEVKNGEGVYGLRRAFVLAGAESTVMSLWSVSDYATRELMKNFYKNLKSGMGRGESLRQVQLQMLKQKGRTHPFYWAAFIESGEWANLDGKR
jgi:CHAT domain-containing protein/uncharacterized protein HemY